MEKFVHGNRMAKFDVTVRQTPHVFSDSPGIYCKVNNVKELRYSKVPPLRNSLHKDSLIGFLCQDILLQNRVCIPWYKKNCYTPNSCQNCEESDIEISTVVRGSSGLSQY